MTNADKFKEVFGIYATELWAMPEADFLKWLNTDRKTEPNNSEIPNNCDTCKYGEDKHRYAHICNECGVGINNYEPKDENHSGEVTEMVKDDPQIESKYPCKRCKHRKVPKVDYPCEYCYEGDRYEPQLTTDCSQTERSNMSEIDKMIKMVDGILGDDDLCEGCEYVIEGLSCDECRRKYADKIIKILRDVKRKSQTEGSK
jgi:protein-arginine kinase activator protein McsA